MKEFKLIGQLFIALAFLVFGIQHFAYLNFVTRAFPPLPLWIPAPEIFACIFGAFLCLTSLAIACRYKAHAFTLWLASAIFIMFAIFLLPSLVFNLKNGFVWTNSGKALVLVGANLLVAGSFATEASTSEASTSNGVLRFLERFIPLGKFLLAGFFILAAVLHFVYAEFVATLIPAWIPAHLFWTYFAAVALIAGAIGMLIPRTAQLAAALSALMVFLWVILLHIPRAWTIHDANETTSLFEALTMCGMGLLIMVNAAKPKTDTKL